jgi:hypothetical protein
MYRRELLFIGALALAVFLTVGAAGWLTVRELHETSRRLVVDTLPGLVDSGLAAERMHDNRHVMYELLFPHTAAERALMVAQVKTNSTDALWQDYATSVFDATDQNNYQVLTLVRSNYLKGCDEYFKLVSAGKMDEASVFFNGELSRNFQSYNDAAKEMFNYNVRQGIRHGKNILNTASSAPWFIAGLCVLVFVFGLVMGLRHSWSGGHYNARKTRNQKSTDRKPGQPGHGL